MKRSKWMEGLLLTEQYIKNGYSPIWIEGEYWYEEDEELKKGIFDYLSHLQIVAQRNSLQE